MPLYYIQALTSHVGLSTKNILFLWLNYANVTYVDAQVSVCKGKAVPLQA